MKSEEEVRAQLRKLAQRTEEGPGSAERSLITAGEKFSLEWVLGKWDDELPAKVSDQV